MRVCAIHLAHTVSRQGSDNVGSGSPHTTINFATTSWNKRERFRMGNVEFVEEKMHERPRNSQWKHHTKNQTKNKKANLIHIFHSAGSSPSPLRVHGSEYLGTRLDRLRPPA